MTRSQSRAFTEPLKPPAAFPSAHGLASPRGLLLAKPVASLRVHCLLGYSCQHLPVCPQLGTGFCSALQTRRTPRLRVAFWEEREALPAPARSPHPGTRCRTHYSLLLTEVLCVLPGQGTVLVILRNGTEHPGTPLACAFPVLGKSQMHSACMWGEGSPERLCSSSMPCRGSEFLPKSNTSRRACSWCQLPWCPCH